MPPIPAKTPEIESDHRRFNMRLKAATFINEIPPKRFPEGSVIAVDGDTAYRWIEHGVAEPAPAHARSYRDEQAEKKRQLLDELEAMGVVEPVYDAAITRDSFRDERIGPKPMPKRGPKPAARGRRGTAARPALDGAGVVNEEQILEDDED